MLLQASGQGSRDQRAIAAQQQTQVRLTVHHAPQTRVVSQSTHTLLCYVVQKVIRQATRQNSGPRTQSVTQQGTAKAQQARPTGERPADDRLL